MGDKVVVITGSSAGIGAATARLLASRGASVVLVARRKGLLETVAAECGERALAVAADVARREEVHRLLTEALGRIPFATYRSAYCAAGLDAGGERLRCRRSPTM